MARKAALNSSGTRSSLLHKLIIVIVILILLISGAILTSVLIFGRSTGSAGDRLVELDVQGENMVDSLATNRYSFSLTNREISDLRSAEMNVVFPDGFILTNTDQPCEEKLTSGCTWLLGKVKRGESKNISIEGYFLGASKTEQDFKTIKGTINFQLEDFSSNFQKQFAKNIFVRPVLTIGLIGLNDAVVGQKSEWQINLSNTSDKTINQVSASLIAPSGFNVEFNQTDSDLFFNQSRLVWAVKNLGPRAERIIKFRGYFSDSNITTAQLIVKADLPDNENKLFLQAESSQEVSVRNENVGLSLLIDASEGALAPSQEIPVYITYNNIPADIKDLTLRLSFSDSSLFNWSDLTTKSWQWQSGGSNLNSQSWLIESSADARSIVWGKAQIGALENLSSADSGTIELNIKSTDVFISNNSLVEIKLTATGKYADNSPFSIAGPVKLLTVKAY
ncbi:MAG: hypothetical protein PHV78_02730 [Patescibacteria group bacterium]|nr:hypothetical protein [Patescibacteria group bacterium]MDD5396138.1 hypothetical protein [Patescibacteria group bacterium]